MEIYDMEGYFSRQYPQLDQYMYHFALDNIFPVVDASLTSIAHVL